MFRAIEGQDGVFHVEQVNSTEGEAAGLRAELQEIVLLPDAVPPLRRARVETTVKYGWVRGLLPAPNAGDIYLARFYFREPSDTSKFTFRLAAYVDRFARAFFIKKPLTSPPARYPSLALARQKAEDGQHTRDGKSYGVAQLYKSDGTPSVAADYVCNKGKYTLFNSWFNFEKFASNMSLNETMARAYFALVYRPQLMRKTVPARGFESIDNLLEGQDAVRTLQRVNTFVAKAEEDSAQQPPAPVLCLTKYILDSGQGLAWQKTCQAGGASGVFVTDPSTYSDQFRLYRDPEAAISLRETWRLESAFNRYAMLRNVLGDQAISATMNQCSLIDDELFHLFPLQLGETIFAYGGTPNEWTLRSNIGQALEEIRVPMRFEATFRADLGTGTIAFEATVPRVHMLPRTAWHRLLKEWRRYTVDELKLNALAYAQRIGIMLAGIAAKQSRTIQTVCVTANWFTEDPEEESPEEAYSVVIDCRKLRAPSAYADAVQHPDLFFARLTSMEDAWNASSFPDKRWAQQDPFWMVSAAPTYGKHFELADLDEKPYQEGSAYALGCSSSLGLAINYNADHRNAAERVAEHLRSMETVSEGIAYLQQERDATSSPDMLQACTRLMTQLAQGSLKMGDQNRIVESFLGDNEFERVLRKLHQAAKGEQKEVEAALSEVEQVVNETMLAGAFADDNRTVYRVFDSSTARVVYNLARVGRLSVAGLTEFAMHDRSKQIKLAPDGYYHCCLELTSIYGNTFQRSDDAIRYGRECIRLAPTNPTGYRQLARAYMLAGEIELARQMLVCALGFATGMIEIAGLYYQLAYVEWKAGRSRTAQACYLHAIADSSDLSLIAASELSELRSEANLDMMAAHEIDPILEQTGIPLAPTAEILDALQDAGRAAINEGAFLAARNILSVQLHHRPDEALYHVLRSLDQ